MPDCRVCESLSAPVDTTTGFCRMALASLRSRRCAQLLIALVVIGCAAADVQSAQYPRYHRNRAYGGVYGGAGNGYRGPGTAQSAAQFGMANVISATGNANLMNSAATRNLTAAKSADIANRVQWTNAYYQMRQTHKAYVASNITRLSTDELNKIAQDQAPKGLDVTQLDSATGVIHWPVILRDKRYIAARDDLERLFKIRAMSTGSIDTESYLDIHRTCEQFHEQLKANVNDYSANDFEHASQFLDSLAHEGTIPAG